jgi:chemotaxis protein CheZ
VDDRSQQLYNKLGELVRYLEMTMRKLRSLEVPLASTATQLPHASEHLRDLTRMTEEGTHTVMELTEAIQDNRARIMEALDALAESVRHRTPAEARGDGVTAIEQVRRWLADDEKRLVQIMTALSFQDLVGQRIAKIVTILDEVEHRLLELVVVFGPKPCAGEPRHEDRADQMLRQLDASRSTALSQELVDGILTQYGF